jgi:membrane fusion protein (multidrug efflux system)
LTKGNLVTPSTGALATVNQLDPIREQFAVADRAIVTAEQKAGTSSARIAKGLVVYLNLPDGSAYRQTGKIAFLGNLVDPQTGTVLVYADFPNPNALLLPGSFVNVDVQRAQPQSQLLVAVQAVQTQQNGSYVLVVGPDNKVREQPVVLGAQIGQDYIVTQGLTAGERVIVEGVQKVQPGETVKPVPGTPGPAASSSSSAASGSD